ncbi:MAG: preprotein translocase subunit SecY [Alphaproteobacteria bacterium]|nr:preprotein translocase subunit SecY [Alphaproteobacteria bacterium]MDE2162100.1 preprotein translocase subunit SecY [Alphaproteobacteria bacterium]MDE2267329.1 preprotein translocase subunit SecY [Alphaproteobacteria bacterium]MDE2499018.1 preprotein translocase subunit SecY [Alphaproteobacteria bacterium]
MPSAAEQLAANFNFSSFSKATELRQRVLFTLGALIVARLGTYIPMPGIDPAGMAHFINTQGGGLLDVFNTLAGGAVQRMAIFALGIMPYISASIIMQLMTTVFPELEALKKEGAAGQKVINQYTRYGTVGLAAVQAFGIAIGLEHAQGIVLNPGVFFRLTAVVTLTGGTILLMWIGEQITSRGVGNGISLIIFAGIVARFPQILGQGLEAARTGAVNPLVLIAFAVFAVALVAFIVFMERAQRRLLVQYPKRQVGQRMFGGESSHLPLKLNVSGVIPPIFASSILLMPTTIATFNAQNMPDWLQTVITYISRGQPVYLLLYGAMIVFFSFFYTSIVFNPEETAENLKKYGGFIPGIRPGKKTAEYIDFVLTRITVVGAAYLAVVCLIPEVMYADYNMSFALGGTSILIVVSVTMDTVAQIQSHLIAQQYEGLIKKAKLRGARR